MAEDSNMIAIPVRLTPETIADLDEQAEKLERTRSWLMRRHITDGIKRKTLR